MSLASIYKEIKKSIVAFVPKYLPHPDVGREIPPVLGSGFVVREDGVIVTNDHVIRSFNAVHRPPKASPEDWGVQAMLLYPDSSGVLDIRIDVVGVARFGPGRPGTSHPDLGMVQVNTAGLPALAVDADLEILEGMEIATAGYPLGRYALASPSGLRQATPTLQRGIVSAVLPYPNPRPRALTVNIMAYGGASGSPVFLTDSGTVVGMLYLALSDIGRTGGNEVYAMPTTISYVVPAHYIQRALALLDSESKMASVKLGRTLKDIICERQPDCHFDQGSGSRRIESPAHPEKKSEFRVLESSNLGQNE